MYADFLFFDHFLVIDLLSQLMVCGRVFHILKGAIQHEYVLLASTLKACFIEVLPIVGWASLQFCCFSPLTILSTVKTHYLTGIEEVNLLHGTLTF